MASSTSPERRISRSPRQMRKEDRDDEECTNHLGNNIHVKNLSRSTKESDLEELFRKYGQIESIKIITEPHTGESRGFAFIILTDGKGASLAIQGLDGYSLHGKKLIVEKAKRSKPRNPTPGQYFGPKRRYEPERYSDHYSGRRYERDHDDRRSHTRSRNYDSEGRSQKTDSHRNDDRNEYRSSRYEPYNSRDRKSKSNDY